jgi:tetratricopeptide (TPR) repeat protein
MRTTLIRGVLVLTAVLAVSAPALAQSIVRGKVVDAQGKPVEGAIITIEAVEATRKAETKTNRNGEFLQVGLQSGRYRVTATKDNLKQQLDANVTQGRPSELQFQLTPVSGMTPEQIKAQQELQTLASGAIAAMKAGQDDDALRQFQEITTKIVSCADCYYNMGVIYTKKQQYAEAEAAFKKVAELRPNAPDAYTGLANVYNAQKKFDLAAEASSKAASMSGAAGGGASAEATFNQGVILWNAGKFAEAKEQFELAVKADPKMSMAQYQLGMANLNLGQIPQARAAFEAYLEADPNGPKSAEVKGFLSQLPK